MGRHSLAALGIFIALWAGFAPPAAAHSPKLHEKPAAGATAAPALPANFPVAFGGAFALTDHEGRARTDEDFLGRYLLVYFGYTNCADICPNDLQVLSDALDGLGRRAEAVQPLFITADPARDTVAHLKAYVANFHPRLIGLTGTEAQVHAAARAYRVHRLKVTPSASEGPMDYLVSHGSLTYLMDRNGRFLTLMPHGTDAERMAEVIGKYVK